MHHVAEVVVRVPKVPGVVENHTEVVNQISGVQFTLVSDDLRNISSSLLILHRASFRSFVCGDHVLLYSEVIYILYLSSCQYRSVMSFINHLALWNAVS